MGDLRFTDVPAQFDPADFEKHRIICGFSILFPILFFLPLIAAADSRLGRFYANQALLLLLVQVLCRLTGFIPFVGGILGGIVGVGVTICSIMGMVFALTGRAKRIPLIGHYDLIR